MTKIIRIFCAILYIQISCFIPQSVSYAAAVAPALGGIDIFQGGINNPTGWVQPTRSYKYTVGADGISLYHGRQKLPITLNTPATPGTTRSVTDYAIAPRAATGAAAAAAGRNTGGGNTGTGNTGAGNTGGGNTGGRNAGAGNTGGGNAGAGNTGGSNTGTGNTGTGNNTASNTSNTSNSSNTTPKKGATALKTAGAVVGGALGAYGIYENTKGQGEHTATNVAGGAISGLLGGMSIGALYGTSGGWIGAGIGAIVGGAFAGSQLFSETDCLYDPIILNKEGKPTFTCCNTAFNKGERQAGIGEYMFCDVTNENGQPLAGVRQCKQGGSETELSWWDGLWEDDAWDAECKPRWCNDNKPPHDNIIPIADTENYCWNWQSATPDASTPDTSTPDAPTDMYGLLIKKLQSAIYAYEKQCGKSK